MPTRTPWGQVGGYQPWQSFRPSDLIACYPMPRWVAQRLRDHPQPPGGSALYDPLPLPFTPTEIRNALYDVWRAKSQPLNRFCASLDPASVRIAMMVLEVLQPRNQAWLDFGSVRGPANLRCLLYRLAGKPLPPAHNVWCLPPYGWVTAYHVVRVTTTFDPRGISMSSLGIDGGPAERPSLPAVVPDGPGGERTRSRRDPVIGADIEQTRLVPDPFVHNLFQIVGSHDIKGD